MLAASVQLAPGRAILSLTRNRRQSLLDQFEDWLINKAGQQNAEAWLGDAQAKAKSQAPTSCRLRMGLLAAMPLMVSASFPWVFPHVQTPAWLLGFGTSKITWYLLHGHRFTVPNFAGY